MPSHFSLHLQKPSPFSLKKHPKQEGKIFFQIMDSKWDHHLHKRFYMELISDDLGKISGFKHYLQYSST